MPSDKIQCPVCGALMNHHADKLIYASDATGDSAQEQVEEFHQCPVCGASVSRLGSMGTPA